MEVKYMDSKEAAEYIGVHVNTLRKYVHKEGLPVFRIPGGRKWKFRKDLLDDWIYERSLPPTVTRPQVDRNDNYGKLRVLIPDEY